MLKNLIISAVCIAGLTGCCKLQCPIDRPAKQECDSSLQCKKDKNCKKSETCLYGTEWELELSSLAGVKAGWVEPEEDITLTIKRDGSVAGFSGVNRFFGGANTVEVDGNKIKFNNMATTMMMGPAMEYETLFLQTIAQADSYKIVDGDELILYKDGVKIAEFED